MDQFKLRPTHKVVKDYYSEIKNLAALGAVNEGAVAPSFAKLLGHSARQVGWTLHEQKALGPIIPDGTLVDEFNLAQGYWEAKDTADDLEAEIKKKLAINYPKNNILFQAPNHMVLVQDGRKVRNEKQPSPETLVEVLRAFFAYRPPAFEQFGQAVEQFKDKVPELAAGLIELIEKERGKNPAFKKALDGFTELCRQAINPNIADAAVEEMLIQHLLTERIFRKVFDNADFTKRNVIAREIESVIQALTARAFTRHDFLKSLDHFYVAIENAAASIEDFTQKQEFLNTVYERFFQGFSVKVADTHGIVYTPQPIVRFMVNSVQEILAKEFGRSLGDEGVHIIDPFVGTGNFILHLMRAMPKMNLPQKYREELHCNEVMLLPYYIAAMNIEHEYYEQTGTYEPFPGICMVDTFELAEELIPDLFAKENTQRVEKQKKSPIFVVIGNPPYNAHQVNENDNNKNRKYKVVDDWVRDTYAKDSKATNKNALSDAYVKAIRWASNRIGDEGIVAFVCNSSFVSDMSFDGMRKNLAGDFDRIYILDLKGNVRKDSMRDGIPIGEQHTVFGLASMVGVSVNFFIKRKRLKKKKVFYSDIDFRATRVEKFELVENAKVYNALKWKELKPDTRHTWLTAGLHDEFDTFMPLGSKKAKAGIADAIFKNYGRGVATSRDVWAYNFRREDLAANMQRMIQAYNDHVARWGALEKKPNPDDFVLNDPTQISWSRDLKLDLKRGHVAEFSEEKIRTSLYRPFTKKHLFFDRIMNEEVYQFPKIFPTPAAEDENRVICVVIEAQIPFSSQITNYLPCLHYGGRQTTCFPFYVYDEDGGNGRENITDWARDEFREHYGDKKIGKWDIFHYVYGLLHHADYRKKYAANLRRDLPHIPFAPDFRAFAKAGKRLAELHVNYENQPEYPLEQIETPGENRDLRVEKMRLSKDKTQIKYNEFLTLAGVPAKAFAYRLGNRSALDWIIDQYRVKTDKRSGIVNDPNRADDDQYIVRLIGRVITVSLETVDIVEALPPLG